MNIGKGIRFVRLAVELRQGEMARQVGISQNYLSMLENNKAEPSIDLLKRIADEFGVPASFLLWEENMPKEGQTPEITERYQRIRGLIHDLQQQRIVGHVDKAKG